MSWWRRLILGFFPQAAQQHQQLEDAGLERAEGVLDAVKVEHGPKRVRCHRSHPLYEQQRPQDCFDCFLLDTTQKEQSDTAIKTDSYLVGALFCLHGFHEGMVFPLLLAEDAPFIVGAGPDGDIVLSDERVSRRHLSMVRRQGRTIVRDLSSLHHSAIRGEGELQWYVLDPEREYWFRDGSHLVLGDVEFLFRAAEEEATRAPAAFAS